VLYRKRLNALRETYIFKNPEAIYEIKEQRLSNYIDKLNVDINNKLMLYKNKLDSLSQSYILNNPRNLYDKQKEKTNVLKDRLNFYILNEVKNSKYRFNQIKSSYVISNPLNITSNLKNDYNILINKLELLNPLSILKKGYSVVSLDNRVVKSINDVNVGDNISIKLYDGYINANVVKKDED
jgi:exodeoxyribonuclease VII large subunit